MLLSNATVHSVEGGVLTVLFAREGDAKGFAASGCDRDLISALTSVLGVNLRIKAMSAAQLASTPGAPRSPHGGPDELSAKAPAAVQMPAPPPEDPGPPEDPVGGSAARQRPGPAGQPGPDRHGPHQARTRRPRHRRDRRALSAPRRAWSVIMARSSRSSPAHQSHDHERTRDWRGRGLHRWAPAAGYAPARPVTGTGCCGHGTSETPGHRTAAQRHSRGDALWVSRRP